MAKGVGRKESHIVCRFCNQRLKSNTTKMAAHLARNWESAPKIVKENFEKKTQKTSFAVKRKMKTDDTHSPTALTEVKITHPASTLIASSQTCRGRHRKSK